MPDAGCEMPGAKRGYGLQGTGAGRVFRSWELEVRRLWKRCAAKCEMLNAKCGMLNEVTGYGLQGTASNEQ